MVRAGVDKIEVDEAKGTVTVTGNADPYEVIVRTRKAGKHAEVVSIGPPPPPPKPPADAQKKPADDKDKKKPEQPNPQPQFHDYPLLPYPQYPQRVVLVLMGYDSYNQSNPSCSIM